jgi:ferredoxin
VGSATRPASALPSVRRGSRSEDGPISLSDPIITLTLITVVLWSAVIGWKLQRKEQAKGNGGAPRTVDWRRGGSSSRDEGRQRDGGRRRRAEKAPPKASRKAPRNAPKQAPRTLQSRGGVKAGAVKVEVEINPGKCARFAFCEHEAPEVFKLNGDRIDYRTSVPADQIDAVAMAVKVCPARAIKMKVPGTKPYMPQPEVDDTLRRPVRR